MLQSTST
jgi:hypothetical protein